MKSNILTDETQKAYWKWKCQEDLWTHHSERRGSTRNIRIDRAAIAVLTVGLFITVFTLLTGASGTYYWLMQIVCGVTVGTTFVLTSTNQELRRRRNAILAAYDASNAAAKTWNELALRDLGNAGYTARGNGEDLDCFTVTDKEATRTMVAVERDGQVWLVTGLMAESTVHAA